MLRADHHLLRDHASGDTTAFAELVGRYRRELIVFLHGILHNRADAEDVSQETFIRVHRWAAKFEAGREFRPWLFVIAQRCAIDLMRINGRRYTLPLDAAVNGGDGGDFLELVDGGVAEQPSVAMERAESRARIRATVAKLPSRFRGVVVLGHIRQMPYRTIAAQLKIPMGTVKSRMHDAMGHLRTNFRSAS